MPNPSKVVWAFIESYAEIKPDEAKMRLHELFMEVARLEEENQELRDEVRELKMALQRRKNLELKDGGYYVIENDTEYGPICPECYERKGFAYMLEGNIGGNGSCTVCGNTYPNARPDGLITEPIKL